MNAARLVRVAVTVAASALVALGALPAPAATPFEIDVIASATGSGAFASQEDINAIRVIESIVNARGGVRGRPISFVIRDDQSNPAVGVQIVNGLIARKVPFFLGPTLTGVCSAVLPLIRENGPTSYCYSPGIHPVQGSYMFSVGVSTREIATSVAHFMRDRGWTRVGILSSTDASGQDFESNFNLALGQNENRSLSLVSREHFAVADISVAAQVTRIKAENPQALIVWTIGTGFGTALRALHDAGSEVPVIGGNGNMVFNQLEQYAAILPKELYFPGLRGLSAKGVGPGPIRQRQSVYFDGFAKAGLRPDGPTTLAWDGTWLVLEALQANGFDVSAQAVRDYIRGRHGWIGINGAYDFGDPEQRGIGANALVMMLYDPVQAAFVPVSRPGGAVR